MVPIEQAANDLTRIADAVSSPPFWQSVTGGVILGSLLTLAIQIILNELQNRRQQHANALQKVLSIRLQFTQLLPRLKDLRKRLEGGAEENFEPVTAWKGIYGNLLLRRAQQDELVKDIDELANTYPIVRAPNRAEVVPPLLEKLNKIIHDCETLVNLGNDELLERFKESIKE